MGGVFVYALLEAAQFALLPVYALDRGMSEAMAAGLLSIWLSGNILLQYPLGWLADRWSRRRGDGRLYAPWRSRGQLLVPLAFATPALLWPLLVLLGGLMGGLYTLSLALIGERFRGADLTQANTAFVMTFQLGAIAGPPYAGRAHAPARGGGLPADADCRRWPAGGGAARRGPRARHRTAPTLTRRRSGLCCAADP